MNEAEYIKGWMRLFREMKATRLETNKIRRKMAISAKKRIPYKMSDTEIKIFAQDREAEQRFLEYRRTKRNLL